MIQIRAARETDVAEIAAVFRAAYDGEYAHDEFQHETSLKRIIYGDDTLMLVAEETTSGAIVASASVVLDVGAYSDLLGELGRLAVHPDARRQGLAHRLTAHRVELIRDRLHMVFVEARTVHSATQRTSEGNGFAAVGFVPMKWLLSGRREAIAFYAQYFDGALALRKNHPRVVPEVYEIASQSLVNVGVEPDLIVDETAPSYPDGETLEISEITADAYADVLRIERGRTRRREVYGPLRLNYGFFKLHAKRSTYLVARRGGRIVAAAGFAREEGESNIRVFELITIEDDAIRQLFVELERRCRVVWSMDYVEVDVSAHAPRMQRTLVELGFLPVAYLPAMVFEQVERLDVIKMVHLLQPYDLGPTVLTPAMQVMADLVLPQFRQGDIVPLLADAIREGAPFMSLTPDQRRFLAAGFGERRFAPGEEVFRRGDDATEMFVLLSGEVEVTRDGRRLPGGTVGVGKCLGEVALLTEDKHSATATALEDVTVGVLTRDVLTKLVRRRPDVGTLVYHEVARDLAEKLRRAGLDQ